MLFSKLEKTIFKKKLILLEGKMKLNKNELKKLMNNWKIVKSISKTWKLLE